MITFGDAHLRNGGSEPIPCVSANMCDGNNYGSHAAHADWGIDGVIAPFWADINPGSSIDGVAGEVGAVFYQIFDSSITVSPHNGQPEAKLLDAAAAEGAAIQGLGRATAAA